MYRIPVGYEDSHVGADRGHPQGSRRSGRSLNRPGVVAPFSRREWQRLVFLPWLYRTGRLHDWLSRAARRARGV